MNKRPPRHRKLRIEALEDRRVLSTTVGSEISQPEYEIRGDAQKANIGQPSDPTSPLPSSGRIDVTIRAHVETEMLDGGQTDTLTWVHLEGFYLGRITQGWTSAQTQIMTGHSGVQTTTDYVAMPDSAYRQARATVSVEGSGTLSLRGTLHTKTAHRWGDVEVAHEESSLQFVLLVRGSFTVNYETVVGRTVWSYGFVFTDDTMAPNQLYSVVQAGALTYVGVTATNQFVSSVMSTNETAYYHTGIDALGNQQTMRQQAVSTLIHTATGTGSILINLSAEMPFGALNVLGMLHRASVQVSVTPGTKSIGQAHLQTDNRTGLNQQRDIFAGNFTATVPAIRYYIQPDIDLILAEWPW